jgi:hypothetical protein
MDGVNWRVCEHETSIQVGVASGVRTTADGTVLVDRILFHIPSMTPPESPPPALVDDAYPLREGPRTYHLHVIGSSFGPLYLEKWLTETKNGDTLLVEGASLAEIKI